jgi:hypothetical protein
MESNVKMYAYYNERMTMTMMMTVLCASVYDA